MLRKKTQSVILIREQTKLCWQAKGSEYKNDLHVNLIFSLSCVGFWSANHRAYIQCCLVITFPGSSYNETASCIELNHKIPPRDFKLFNSYLSHISFLDRLSLLPILNGSASISNRK